MPRRRLAIPLSAILLLAAASCDESPPAEEIGAPEAPPEAEAEPAPPPEPAPYRVEVLDWEGPVGKKGAVVVTVEADEGHEINEDYPQELTLEEVDGLELPVRELRLADAEIESERRMTFTVPTVPTRMGQYDLAGTMSLGVCRAGQCRTARERIVARVTAQ